jgi:hypothetical protein
MLPLKLGEQASDPVLLIIGRHGEIILRLRVTAAPGKRGAVGEAIFVQGLDQVLACLLLLLCIPFFHPGPEKLHQLATRIPGRQVLVKKAESQSIRRQVLPLGLMLKPIFKIRWKA